MVSTTTQPSNLEQMFAGMALVPGLIEMMKEQSRQFAALREEMARKNNLVEEPDGWLDAKAAAKYLNLSAGSFDKYRYTTSPRITGYPLDGKTLYKRSELDNFVRLYALKSEGLA